MAKVFYLLAILAMAIVLTACPPHPPSELKPASGPLVDVKSIVQYQPKVTSTQNGIYLPELYLADLAVSRSHTRSLDKFSSDQSAIILRSSDVLIFVNYHEGSGGRIVYRDSKRITYDSGLSEKTLQIGDKALTNAQGIRYVKVSDMASKDPTILLGEIEKIVSTVLFMGKLYASGSIQAFCNNGTIYINKEIYELYLTRIFISTIHDAVHNKAGTKYLEFKKDKLQVLEAIIPKGLEGDPYAIMQAKYKSAWELTTQTPY